MNLSRKHRDAPIVGDGGIKRPVVTERDSFDVLIDLMEVVEALCPRWPQREITEGNNFKL